jgi:hypothetical protein
MNSSRCSASATSTATPILASRARFHPASTAMPQMRSTSRDTSCADRLARKRSVSSIAFVMILITSPARIRSFATGGLTS